MRAPGMKFQLGCILTPPGLEFIVIEWIVEVVVFRIYNMGSICKIAPDGKGKSQNQWNPNDSKRNQLN